MNTPIWFSAILMTANVSALVINNVRIYRLKRKIDRLEGN